MSRGIDRYRIVIPTDAPPWAQRLEAEFNALFLRIARDTKPRRFTVVDLPRDGSETVAIVTNESGGIVLAFYDESTDEWRRVTDRALVS